ncbi:MAG: hypothetical protein P1P88_07695 [Bacteroidales bacterium]|nr:hypothetical protein [Bacteroidales bacterium]
MKAIRNYSLLAILIFFSLNLNAQKKKSEWINGIWRGTGFQLDNSSSWSIRFVANTKTKIYKIDYGTLSCGGNWELVSIDENRAVFIEKITDGVDKCLNGSTIIITFVSDNYLSYSCFSPGGKKLDACSTLERAEF